MKKKPIRKLKVKPHYVEQPETKTVIRQDGIVQRYFYSNRPIPKSKCANCNNLCCSCPSEIDIAYIFSMLAFRTSTDMN